MGVAKDQAGGCPIERQNLGVFGLAPLVQRSGTVLGIAGHDLCEKCGLRFVAVSFSSFTCLLSYSLLRSAERYGARFLRMTGLLICRVKVYVSTDPLTHYTRVECGCPLFNATPFCLPFVSL